MKKCKKQAAKLLDILPHKEVEKTPCAVTTLLHDLGLAVWFGGNVMGILAVNPSVEVLDDPEERGKLVDEAWARFQPYSTLGLLTAVVTHIAIRRRGPKKPSGFYTLTARLQDLAVLTAIGSSIASLALGEYETAALPEDYTPKDEVTDSDYLDSAPKGLSPTAWLQLGSGIAIFVLGAVLSSNCARKK